MSGLRLNLTLKMNLSEIRDLIRAEAGIPGIFEFDSLIDTIVNQELRELTGKSKYPEMLRSAEIIYANDSLHEFPLPEDFQLMDKVSYWHDGDDEGAVEELSKGRSNQWRSLTMGTPLYYERMGANLQIYPYTDATVNDKLTISYYGFTVLTLDTDEFPVPSLEKATIQFAMARFLRATDTKRAQMAAAEGEKAWRDSRVEDAAN